MLLKDGDPAPGFSLYDSEKHKVSLDDYRGKNVVILFFPFAFSSVCTQELCDMRDNLTVYNSYDCDILAISVDSLYTLAKYKADQHLNFKLLSDFNKEVSNSYNVLYETFPSYEFKGVSKRAAFVIDHTGIIRYSEICSKPGDLPDFNAIQIVLSTIN